MKSHYLILISGIILLLLANSLFAQGLEKTRILKHNQKEVKTSFHIDTKFFGKYEGRKEGYLVLNEDGTGSYRYDYQMFLPQNCTPGEIKFNWGFIVNEDEEVVRFKRDYGFSYPIIYSCVGENSFQGCTKTSMVDYLLVYKDGSITVSSSDDWKK